MKHDNNAEQVREKLASSLPHDVTNRAEILCLPAFAPEVFLSVSKEARRTTLRLRTFQSSYWDAESDRSLEIQGECAVVPELLAGQFWSEIAELNPSTIKAEKCLGLDGVTVSALFQDRETLHEFETWSPIGDSPEAKFINSILRLAGMLLKEPTSLERLSTLAFYMGTAR